MDVDGPDTVGTNADLCPWVLTTDVLCPAEGRKEGATEMVEGATERVEGATRGPLTTEWPGCLAEVVAAGFLCKGAAGPATNETNSGTGLIRGAAAFVTGHCFELEWAGP